MQALGYCNHELCGRLLEYFAYWAYVKGLRIGSKVLEEDIQSAGIEPEKLSYEVRRLMNDAVYQEMTFEELTGLADEDIRNGWYIRFLELLTEKRRYRLVVGFLAMIDTPEKRLHLMDDLKIMEGLLKMRQRARKAGLLLSYGGQ